MIEKEIKFEFSNYLSRETLELFIEINDDGTIYGNAIHRLPAKFGGHPGLDFPAEIKENEHIRLLDQRELTYPIFENKENKEFLEIWLTKIQSINFGSIIINENYMYTTDGTYGTLYLKIGENEMNYGLRNFENHNSGNLISWISELINHFGIDSNKLFGIE